MTLYETVLIIRQDVSSADVDKLTDEYVKFVEQSGSKLVKSEYWGLRTLAYDINNNKKGHYVLLCTESEPSVITELERKMKFSEDIIRFMSIKVDSFSDKPSPILRDKSETGEESIDVTVE